MQYGLLSRNTMERRRLGYYPTDNVRLDSKLHAISLSVSTPNEKMFYTKRCDLGKNVDWVVLLLDPKLLWEKDCAFYPSNAANGDFKNTSVSEFQTVNAFEAMFVDSSERSASLRDCHTTDVQAEVMVFDSIETKYIKGFVLEHVFAFVECRSALRNHEVRTYEDKRFFGQREWELAPRLFGFFKGNK